MTSKKQSMFEIIKIRFFKYKMKERDKKLFIEATILIVIYLLSFTILSLGWVQRTFFGMSTLTFTFAVIITWVVYYAYKRVMR